MDQKLRKDRSPEQMPPKLVVYPTHRTTSVVKVNSVGYVPHEPVKGAVLPLSKSPSARQDISHDDLEWRRSPVFGQKFPRKERIVFEAPPEVTVIQTANRKLEQAPQQLQSKLESSKQSGALSCKDIQYSGSQVSCEKLARGLESFIPSSLHQHPLPSIRTVMNASSELELPADGEKVRERHLLDDPTNRSSEITRLKEELEVVTKVNSDLKKLLVASIGDDLHYKVDALVRTKVQLANEIGDYTRKLVEDYEDLDKLTIQADLWHSKYQASRVLVEQLSSECERLSNSFVQAQMALESSIQERQELNKLLVLARRNLLELVPSYKAISKKKGFEARCPHSLELAGDIKRLSDEACRTLVGRTPDYVNDVDANQSFTPAELLTHQVLSFAKVNGSNVVSGRRTSAYVARPASLFHPRFHPEVRYEGFTFTSCSRCKGEVIVV